MTDGSHPFGYAPGTPHGREMDSGIGNVRVLCAISRVSGFLWGISSPTTCRCHGESAMMFLFSIDSIPPPKCSGNSRYVHMQGKTRVFIWNSIYEFHERNL